MKSLLALCLVVYFLAEASAKPAPQWLDQAGDMLKKAKDSAQDALNQAQESMTRTLEAAKTAIQNGLNSMQQTAQSKIGLGEYSTQNESSPSQNPPAA